MQQVKNMNDLAIQLTEDGSRHLYEQIYEYIRDELGGGSSCGEKLLHASPWRNICRWRAARWSLPMGSCLSRVYRSLRLPGLLCVPSGGALPDDVGAPGEGDGNDKPTCSKSKQKAFDYDFLPTPLT